MARHNIVGFEGENLAAHFLVDRGFEILHRNFRIGRLEIDVIARKGCVVHFVEVKTRSVRGVAVDDFSPEKAFSQSKKERLMRAAAIFVDDLGEGDEGVEFSLDLVAVCLFDDGSKDIKFYEALHF